MNRQCSDSLITSLMSRLSAKAKQTHPAARLEFCGTHFQATMGATGVKVEPKAAFFKRF